MEHKPILIAWQVVGDLCSASADDVKYLADGGVLEGDQTSGGRGSTSKMIKLCRLHGSYPMGRRLQTRPERLARRLTRKRQSCELILIAAWRVPV